MNFAACELPPLKTGDRRYRFDTIEDVLEFCAGVEGMNFLDDQTVMVVRLSTEGLWAVDFEQINEQVATAGVMKSPVLENPPATGSQADYAQ
jgi:hypothetical protein